MSTSIYTTVKEQGASAQSIAAAKEALLAVTPAVTEKADQPHAILGMTKNAGDQNVFWFSTVQAGKDAQEAIASLRAGLYGYLVTRQIPLESLRGFEIKAVPQTADELAQNKEFLEQLATLGADQKYLNFVDFVGKRDLTPKYKSRGRR